MWIDDLAPYCYGCEPEPNRLAVGWLDPANPFARGEVGSEMVHDRFLAVLRWAVVNRSVDAYRGFHYCELGDCGSSADREPSESPVVDYGGHTTVVGHAQIEVEGRDGVSYVAPNLIVHYVEAHRYRPPDEFVRAALVGEWRREVRVRGSFRFVGPGIVIDDWSAELATVLWDQLATNLGEPVSEVRRLVRVEVRPAEVSCQHTLAGLPSVAVTIAPTATTWLKSSQWQPTNAGTRALAARVAEIIEGVRR